MKYLYCLLVLATFVFLTSCQRPCRSKEFECYDGQCISLQSVCDGQFDCYDGSDEAPIICHVPSFTTGRTTQKPSSTTIQRSQVSPLPTAEKSNSAVKIEPRFLCKLSEFSCLSGECIDNDLVCNERKDCQDGSDESPSICAVNTPKEPEKSNEGFDINFPAKLVTCDSPRQPAHGHWMLHKSLCKGDRNCEPPASLKTMLPGSYLVYGCDRGYQIKGSSDVLCGPGGKWVTIPTCEEIRCNGLSNKGTEAYCLSNNKKVVPCDSDATPGTKASLACRNGFTRADDSSTSGSQVTCQADGKWKPEPIRCTAKSNIEKVIVDGEVFVKKDTSLG